MTPLPDIGRVQAAALIRRAYEEAERPPFMLTTGTKAGLLAWLRDNSPLDHAEIQARERRAAQAQHRAVVAQLYPTQGRQVMATTKEAPAALATPRGLTGGEISDDHAA